MMAFCLGHYFLLGGVRVGCGGLWWGQSRDGMGVGVVVGVVTEAVFTPLSKL